MASPAGLVPSTSSINMTVTAPENLLAACSCLNVKLHLAEPSGPSVAGTETKLGLAGVSVEQKILCSMSISGDQTTVYCNNCNHKVYTFSTVSNTAQLEPTSLAFLNSSILFSPSSGIVVPSESIVTSDGIAALLKDSDYSKSFRLVLAPSSPSPTEATSTISTNINSTSQHLYQPHLEKVRTLLDKELEANISAQQQQTEARIEAYKSQQQFALQASIVSTRREKERLWAKIQDRVSAPPTLSVGEGHSHSPGLQPAPLENGTHPFDGPSTLPIRLTNVSRDGLLHGSFTDRRKSAVAEMAMSHQFREFDQRMASNSLRRQSLVPGSTPLPHSAGLAPTQERSALSTSHASVASEASHNSAASTSPAPKSKKRVTIVDTVSIVEPASHDDDDESNIIGERSTFYSGNDDEDDDGEDGGVVFDLDEELGFDGEGQQDGFDEDSDDDFTSDDRDLNGGEGSSTNGSSSINISISRASPPKSGMVVGSLRANYLRRQRGLEQHKKSLTNGPGDDEGDEDENDDLEDGEQPVTYFGTSLPIQIQARQPAIPPPPARTSAIASSLAMPPPAAAMLQRRLSRAYGNDNVPEPQTSRSTNLRSGSVSNLASSLAEASLNIPGTAPGTVIIDPLMLLEEEHDADDREDRLRKHRQQFSSINHRRDLEQRQHELDSATTAASITTTATIATITSSSSSFSQSLARSAQADFEPPHVYSARTYVGSTPWEMPTRITVKSGGYQREGTHLDKQIALEMAQEQEKERKELESTLQRVVDSSVAHHHHQLPPRHVDKIDEGEEEIDEEDEEAKKPTTTPSSG
ncbi:hypothetical protein BGZ59_008861 [Podila verticillata]|nr:hypothetical protein BGZ59_008861 [Podila verticillata]